ncbi:hypothetical protein QBC34DRAFT_444472 [Podospora aff. communis PSN243]|uniref:Peptidase S8/S53 domain-containing protein n=1 Tax=Podospora aff. communis PSN243 TaxID=3040156 RepID=A0AAV9G4B3_9PEZI|nr:hypothetical protein QBC34DRAFT_444472 [Podospora aff. communis PSN243]
MTQEWTKDMVEFLFEYRERNENPIVGVFLNQPLKLSTHQTVTSSENGKQVDIIVMANGFLTANADMEEAILDAVRHKILVFTGAGNHGNHHRVAFPARMAEIICIFATDAGDKAPRLNPRVFLAGRRALDLRRRDKMSAVFGKLSEDYGDQDYDCVVPWRMSELVSEYSDREETRRKICSLLGDWVVDYLKRMPIFPGSRYRCTMAIV